MIYAVVFVLFSVLNGCGVGWEGIIILIIIIIYVIDDG